ncbi:MAG: polyprenyl synthetase family protein [Chitinophagales bacterium]
MRSIEALRALFIQHLQENRLEGNPSNLYEPCNYFLQIGGKRLRPTLLLLAHELFGGNVEEALPAALSIEYFHNFTLIHDDVMDKAPVRRGFVTVHEKYNLNTAILSGDTLLIKAYQCLNKVDERYFKKTVELYTQTAIEVCEGQQYDIDFETQETVSHEEYIEMIRLKTAVLLAASMKIGAILANAADTDADLLYSYAENLGIGFQIQDDILDCYGDEKLVGKQPGGDIIQNKKTLLLIEAKRISAAQNDQRLEQLIENYNIDNAEKVNKMLSIFEEYDIKSFGMKQRNFYIEQSLKALEQLNLPQEKKEVLKQLVDYLVLRNF